MSAALRVATVTPRALPHRAASGATAGPSRDPHPRWARLGPRRRATPLPESTRRLSAERTRATARASTTDESSPSSGGEARQNTTDGVARIARREALARVEASLNRNDDWRNVLAVIEDASRASGVPPARCVRTTRLWGHAGARWDLPAVLAVLRALDGADFAACVRAVGEKGGARDALEVYKEGIKAGYHRDDGGASRAAMAWVHDGIGQGKQADALWVDMHAEARLGRVDVAKCARVAAGLNNWNRGARGRSIPSVSASCADDDGTTETRESIIESIVEEVYALEIASKARRRPRAPPRMRTRASATAAERIARNSSLRWRIPARTARRIRRFGPRFPRACTPPRAGRRRRSGIPASRVTSRWTSSATAIASRTITWWRRWRPSSERRERPPPPTPWRRSFNRPDAQGTMRGVQRVPMEVPTVTTTVMTVITVSGARRGPASSERCAARAERLGRRNCWTRWRPSRSCAAGHRAPPRAARCPVTRRQAAAARGPPSSTSASGRMKKPTATRRRRRGRRTPNARAEPPRSAEPPRPRTRSSCTRSSPPAPPGVARGRRWTSTRRWPRTASRRRKTRGTTARCTRRCFAGAARGVGGCRRCRRRRRASRTPWSSSEHLTMGVRRGRRVTSSSLAPRLRLARRFTSPPSRAYPTFHRGRWRTCEPRGWRRCRRISSSRSRRSSARGTRRGRWRCGRRTSPRWTSSNESPSPYRGDGRDGRGAIKERMTPAAWAWAGWVANPRGGRGRP